MQELPDFGRAPALCAPGVLLISLAEAYMLKLAPPPPPPPPPLLLLPCNNLTVMADDQQQQAGQLQQGALSGAVPGAASLPSALSGLQQGTEATTALHYDKIKNSIW